MNSPRIQSFSLKMSELVAWVLLYDLLLCVHVNLLVYTVNHLIFAVLTFCDCKRLTYLRDLIMTVSHFLFSYGLLLTTLIVVE